MRCRLVGGWAFIAWSLVQASLSSAAAHPGFYPANAARGKTLAAACSACHASAAASGLPFHVAKLQGQRPEVLFAALLEYRQKDRRSAVMTAIAAELSLQDMRDLSLYLAGAASRPRRETLPETWAHTKVLDDCAACHGETGLGLMPGTPVLGGQRADYLIDALQAYRAGSRTNPTMTVMARKLTPDQIGQLAHYFEDRGYLSDADDSIESAAPATLSKPSMPEQARDLSPQPNSVRASIELAEVSGGSFLMGSTDSGFQNGFPAHRVTVRTFRLARYDVTFDQYDAFAHATHRPRPPDEGWGRGARPVVNVEWSDIRGFIEWLNQGTHRRFRLPSEAEWEYAARAGTTTAYWWGDEPDSNEANTATNAGRDVWLFTSPVGSFPANPFGLYDMLGNVWQFVADCRHLTYTSAPVDGSAWLDGDCDSRVVRGGFYGSLKLGMRSNSRGAAGERFHSMGLGFRLAESIDSKDSNARR